MSDLVSQRQFAKEIGRSNVWVSKLVKEGKIPVDASGKIPLAAGKEAYLASQQPGYEEQRKKASSNRGNSKKVSQLPDESEEGLAGSSDMTVAKVNQAFNKARLAKETYLAKLKELEYNKEKGLLIAKDEVEADAKDTALKMLARFRSIPSNVALDCEGKDARVIQGILEEEIEKAFAQIYRSKYIKKGSLEEQ